MLLYEIYIRKFNDFNNDGIGDLSGVIQKLCYLKNLGVTHIWITPFYPSPLVDNGYDVSDYVDVDKRIGTIDEFRLLIKKAHEIKIKIIIDVVFNHCSNQHIWFKKALLNDKKYMDYFIFRDEPLNNWQSMFKSSAWSYAEKINKYYLHRFAKEQPDLNLTNIDLINELNAILAFWIDLKVDGFRFDVVNFFISDLEMLNNDNTTDIRYDINNKKTPLIIKEFKKFVKSYTSNDILFIGEVGSEELSVLKSYTSKDLMDYVFTFNLSAINNLNMKEFGERLISTYKVIDNPTIFFSSHDMKRFYNRLCKYDKRTYEMVCELIFTLKGMKILYQGDECMQRDFHPQTIDDIEDIQALNEYKIDKINTLDTKFKTALKSTRDYSRNFIDFNEENTKKICKLSNKYLTKFYNESDIEILNNEKDILKFKRYDNNKEVIFEFNFKEKTISESQVFKSTKIIRD